MNRISVLLADDHDIMREGLRSLLGHSEDVEVVGEANDGAGAVTLVEKLRPNIVIMDIAMPGMGGLEATRLICSLYPKTKVLVLTQYEDFQYIQSILQAGASGYVTKRTLGSDLIAAIHILYRGETYLQPRVTTKLVEHVRHLTGSTVECLGMIPESLTTREQEILMHIANGKTNSQIGLMLCVSIKTVEWHRSNLMSKLGAHNSADLVRYAYSHGMVA